MLTVLCLTVLPEEQSPLSTGAQVPLLGETEHHAPGMLTGDHFDLTIDYLPGNFTGETSVGYSGQRFGAWTDAAMARGRHRHAGGDVLHWAGKISCGSSKQLHASLQL
jgi:hypothetical protein